jgi:hypothetical protein
MIWPKAVGGLLLCLRRDDLDWAISERIHHVLSWLLIIVLHVQYLLLLLILPNGSAINIEWARIWCGIAS